MNDGGPAFPTLRPDMASCTLGMSRRQWLAGLAMQGLVASDELSGNSCRSIAMIAYEMADAMLAHEEEERK